MFIVETDCENNWKKKFDENCEIFEIIDEKRVREK